MSFFPKQTVLVPVDFSDASFEAVEVARQLISDPSHLHIVHVTQPLYIAEPNMLWGSMSESTRLDMARKTMLEELATRKLDGFSIHTQLGLPGQEIADLATELGAELIVMPSHGRSGVQRFLLGSVTEKVLRLAPCPVLVLRATKSEE